MMMTLAGSLATTVDPGHQATNEPGFGPSQWTREFQARLGRLLASDADHGADVRPDSDVGLEREGAGLPSALPDGETGARLEGVQLAAREIAHLVNNDLAVTVGTLDLLRGRPDVSPEMRALLEQALAGLNSAATHVERLQRVQRVVVRETPAGLSLDLERSV